MKSWLSENPDIEKTVFQELARDLIAQDLAANPRELSDEEQQELGMKLTLAYQDEKGEGYDHSELVVKYGTPQQVTLYKQATEE